MIRVLTIIAVAELVARGAFCLPDPAIESSRSKQHAANGSPAPLYYHSLIALIHIDGVPKCSGSFIDLNIVLTHIDCASVSPLTRVTVKVRNSQNHDIDATYTVLTSAYIESTKNNSLGFGANFLLLNGPVVVRDTNEVMKLPRQNDTIPKNGTVVTLFGWDTKQRDHVNGVQVESLLRIDLIIELSNSSCGEMLNVTGTNGGIICASSGGQILPKEFLGGPIILDETIVGVASFIKKLDDDHFLVVSTALAPHFKNIKQLIGSFYINYSPQSVFLTQKSKSLNKTDIISLTQNHWGKP